MKIKPTDGLQVRENYSVQGVNCSEGLMDMYKYVAIILVYRNVFDLVECIESMRSMIADLRIIVVNSFYDEKSRSEAKLVAEKYDCDFLNVENRGYGSGNNRGIEFARERYKFKYIIVSNPDIIVKSFDDKGAEAPVIAPDITAASGKKQNPMIVKRNSLGERLIYEGLKRRWKFPFLLGVGINKCVREFYLFARKSRESFKIYAPHGSFVMIRGDVVEKLFPVYDEKMFLFAEESVLAKRLFDARFDVMYTKKICVFHKEDGSMKLSDLKINEELRKSNIYYYENYIKI